MQVMCADCGHFVEAPVGEGNNPELSMNTATIIRGTEVRFKFLCDACADKL